MTLLIYACLTVAFLAAIPIGERLAVAWLLRRR